MGSKIEGQRPTDLNTAVAADMSSSPSNNAGPFVAAAAVATTTTTTAANNAVITNVNNDVVMSENDNKDNENNKESNTTNTTTTNKTDSDTRTNTTKKPAPKKLLVNQSITMITDPNKNDVLSGPGLRIHQHVGNIQHRSLINAKKTDYLAVSSTKKGATKKEYAEKAHIVAEIVHTIRTMDPPGRFLKEDKTNTTGTMWYEIDNAAALQKTRKALTGNNTKRNRNPLTVKRPPITPWNDMLFQLTKYKNEQGTFFIPPTDTAHKQLRTWICSQRHSYVANEMIEQRIHALNDIDFIWNERNVAWENKVQELKKYMHDKGHMKVNKQGTVTDRSLYRWIKFQRRYKRDNKLKPERIVTLNNMNFQWDPTKRGSATAEIAASMEEEDEQNGDGGKGATDEIASSMDEEEDEQKGAGGRSASDEIASSTDEEDETNDDGDKFDSINSCSV